MLNFEISVSLSLAVPWDYAGRLSIGWLCNRHSALKPALRKCRCGNKVFRRKCFLPKIFVISQNLGLLASIRM